MKLYFNNKQVAIPQNFMFAFQFSVFAIGVGLTLRHKPIFSITLCFYKWSITLGVNGYLQ